MARNRDQDRQRERERDKDRLTETALVHLTPQDAAALFVARNGGAGLDATEELLLADWLKKSTSNRQEYESADRIWQTFVNIKGGEIASAIRAQAAAERKKKMRTRGALIAAGIVLVLAISGVVIFTSTLNPWKAGPETQKAMAITVIPYSTLRGEVRVEQLPDGSQMNIDADSVVVGRFGPVGRQVEVQKGRALFRVTPDEKRGFIVVARGRSIVALGTRFDVNVLARGLIVTLLEGHVVIDTKQPGKSPVVLVSGQQYVERGGEGTVRNVTDGEKVAAWRTGIIAFDETPLGEAVQVMNRYTLKRYDIADPAVGKLAVSGEFHAVDEKAFTSALAERLGVKASSEGDVIELTRE